MPWLKKGDSALVALEGTTLMPAGPRVSMIPDEARGVADPRGFLLSGWHAVRAYVHQKPLPDVAQRRILGMVNAGIDPAVRGHFSWPLDVIVDESGAVIGYVSNCMRDAVPLRSLAVQSGALSYLQRLCIAKNICIALDAFHRQGLVFGNLTYDAVLVERRTCRVFLNPGEDAQFETSRGESFLCPMVVPEYLAPEVQLLIARGVSVFGDRAAGRSGGFGRASVLSQETDAFALGVIVFALLNGDRHPMSYRLEGEETIERLSSISGKECGRWQGYVPAMMGRGQPFASSGEGFAVPAYRLPWFRIKGAGALYDRCFTFLDASGIGRPSAQDWHALLERKARGAKARVLRLANGLTSRISSLRRQPHAAVTSVQAKHTIRYQYPSDLVGSEALTSPRVFRRTTGLFALGLGLCSSIYPFALQTVFTSSLGLLAVALDSAAFFMGSLIGMAAANSVLEKRRGLRGYCPGHYAASFLCAFATSMLCGVVMGGVL